MALVKFVATDLLSYTSLATKDVDTLYFVEDEQRIYKGTTPYGGFDYQLVTTDPATPKTGVLYINTATNTVKIYDGTQLLDIVKAPVTTIDGTTATNDTQSPSVKAVYDFVLNEVKKVDASGIAANLTEIEGRLDVIEGEDTVEGSVAKALADAKEYTDGRETEINKEIAKKADAATTLAGYGITDAYTKTETDTAIAEAIADVDHIKKSIVEALPDVTDADDNTIYMVPVKDGEDIKYYREYLLVGGAFEEIGNTEIDLSDYYTKTETDTAITDAIGELDYDNSAELLEYDHLVLKTIKQVDGKIVPEYIAGPMIINDVEEGTANGSIKVNYKIDWLGGPDKQKSKEITIKGLDTAAYKKVEDFDEAGAADQALQDAKDYIDGLLTWKTL